MPAEKEVFYRSKHFLKNGDIVHCALGNGVDSYVNGQLLSECQASLTERMKERKKKEKSRFNGESDSVGRRSIWKVPLCILVLFYTQITIVRLRTLESVPILELLIFSFSIVLHILWTIQAIPT